MTVRKRIQIQYGAVLAGLAVGLVVGLCGLFWLDSRVLLLCGMAALAATIVAGEKRMRCPFCARSVYAEIAREAAFTPKGVPTVCPKCQADWINSAADWTQSAVDGPSSAAEANQSGPDHPEDHK